MKFPLNDRKAQTQNHIKAGKSQGKPRVLQQRLTSQSAASAPSRDGETGRRETWIGSDIFFPLTSPRRKRLALKFPNFDMTATIENNMPPKHIF